MLKFFVLVNLVVLLPIFVFGIIISKINNVVSKKMHTKSKWWIYTMCGFIGTPIHELSHLICNLIFFHKITDVALYRPVKSKKDGVLGYVEFTYKENSLYQNIGLFFSGIAPMIGGSLVLFILMKFLIPNVFISLEYFEISNLDLLEIVLNLKSNMITNLKLVFTNYSSLERLVLFLILAFSISTHMHISTADLRQAVKGGIIVEIFLLIISILLEYYKLSSFTSCILVVSSYLITFLVIGLIFSLISLVISYLISFIPE